MSQTRPAKDQLLARYQAGEPQLVWRRCVADLETPISAYRKLIGDTPYGFLMESVEGSERLGRYSVIGGHPDLIWQSRDGAALLCDPETGAETADGASLDSLRRLLKASAIDLDPDLPPMAAGLFGYLGYDMVRLIERLPDGNPHPLGIADAVLVRPALVAVFDNIGRDVLLATPLRPQGGIAGEDALAAAEARLDDALAKLAQPLPPEPLKELPPPPPDIAPQSNFDRAGYEAVVERVREYIYAGDAFQVVPSQRFSRPYPGDPFGMYRALRRLNPSPFLFYQDFKNFQIIGSSPEILVRLRHDTVTVRPIAGTRPRGRDEVEDQALAHELLADEKELAEHLMLLDLGRNDVGRVAEADTVRVTERFEVERYSHVMHIVSNVEGRLKPGLDALDALFAGFPAGTVSGAPKVRAMEIIEEMEPVRRGVYAGAVGYLGAGGDMDTCIALRTGLIKDGTLYVQAGGGVVADSEPAAEYEETQNKARALLRAAALAEQLDAAGDQDGSD